MRHTPGGDDPHRDVVKAYSGSLFATTFEFSTLWSRVNSACNTILSWDSSPEFRGQRAIQLVMRAYTIVYRLVSAPCLDCPKLVRGASAQQDVVGNGDEGTQALVVYYLLRETIRKRLSSVVSARLKDAIHSPIPVLLETYIAEWKTYIVAVNNLKVVFSYLHGPWQKFGLPTEHQLLPTEVVALLHWSETIMSPDIRESLATQVFDLVAMDRQCPLDGEKASLLREVAHALGMLSDSRHTLYVAMIEEPYVMLLGDFYKGNVLTMRCEGILSYIERALSVFTDETDRASRLLSKSSIPVVVHRIADVLVDEQLLYLKPFMPEWILSNNSTQLHMLYRLLSKSSAGVVELSDAFQNSVFEKGTQDITRACEENIRSNGNVYRALLEGVISVYTYFTSVKNAFEGNETLEKAMFTGLEKVLANCSYIKSNTVLGDELARFAHAKFNSFETNDHCEEVVNKVVTLFRLLPLKSSFLESYPRFLSSRLLFDSYCEEHERLAIQKISQSRECTSDFVHRCEVMLNDITESSVLLRNEFNSSIPEEDSSSKGWVFQPIILTSYSWPDLPQDSHFPTPKILVPKLIGFQTFYSEMCPKRHVTYIARLSRGMLRMNLPHGSRLPSMDLYIGQSQLVVAELFNIRKEWRIDALFEAAEVDNTEIFLQAINSFVKYGILEVCDERGTIDLPLRAVIVGQLVRIGRSPDTRKRKLKLFPSELEEGFHIAAGRSTDLVSDHVDASNHLVDEMKSPAIQAALIRVFKSVGTLSFTQLLEKVKDESHPHFTPSAQQVKLVLEFLISRGFVTRDDTEGGTFTYVS